jgi:hypothetical protein
MKMLALIGMLFVAAASGTTVARADGGETGASASHTQPWYNSSGYYYSSPYGYPDR